MLHIQNENTNKNSYKLLRIAVNIGELDSKTRNYGTDVSLSTAGIHIVQAVSNNPGLSVTDIAKQLGITKGAVSQQLFQLEKKGIVVKQIDANNTSRMNILLTEKGKKVSLEHQRLHALFEAKVENIMKQYSEDERQLLSDFLSQLDETIRTMEV